MTDLREQVRAALDNALDRGYEGFKDRNSDYFIALDLQEYNTELENCDVMEVIPFVKEWRMEKRL